MVVLSRTTSSIVKEWRRARLRRTLAVFSLLYPLTPQIGANVSKLDEGWQLCMICPPRRSYDPFLSIHTGLRSGECAGLQWPDVDFRNRYILVRRTLTPHGDLKAPKNGKERKVDLSDAAIAVLKAHRAKLQAEYLKEGKPLPESVFPNREGRPHNMTNVRNRIFYRALDKAGLHRRPLHSTRHAFATLLLNQGESPVYVKEQMGHSSIKITVDVYGKWIRTPDRQAVNLCLRSRRSLRRCSRLGGNQWQPSLKLEKARLSPGLNSLTLNGVDETRTRDLLRDRQAF